MKNIAYILFAFFLLNGCSNSAKEESDLKNEIIAMHEKMMSNDEALMKNEMKLDTLLKQKKDTLALKPLVARLNAADDAMDKWMSQFQPDMTGKSHDEVVSYYTGQKKLVLAVDSQIKTAINESNKYLNAHK